MNLSIFHQQIVPIRSKLYRFALRITGSSHEAEDVVQDVLERVWKAPEPAAGAVQNWEAWCMTLTRNRSIDRTRMQNRRSEPLEKVAERPGNQISPAKAAETGDLVAQIRRFMQDLPEKQRTVMHLRDIEEMTYDEIAETLQISMDSVKVSLHRARRAVREKLLELEKS